MNNFVIAALVGAALIVGVWAQCHAAAMCQGIFVPIF